MINEIYNLSNLVRTILVISLCFSLILLLKSNNTKKHNNTISKTFSELFTYDVEEDF